MIDMTCSIASRPQPVSGERRRGEGGGGVKHKQINQGFTFSTVLNTTLLATVTFFFDQTNEVNFK